MTTPALDKTVQLWKLLRYKTVLKQLRSFSDDVIKCDFVMFRGWGGKIYVDKHECNSIGPLRGVDMLDICYLKLTDTVVLTEEQFADYLRVREEYLT